MQELFKPIYLDIKDKSGNLEIEAKSKVKSTKYFPKFTINKEEYIFKPLSKTKPLTTPLFAYSEVYWSYLTNKYFDSKAPLYKLAYCKGLSEEQEKYYDYGTIVKSTITKNQKLINLYEYLQKYPDKNINISNYINYCMKVYDYTDILQSDFLNLNNELGKKVVWQILLSILRRDQNFHYENINFITENNQIIDINPPIDYEFSNMFLYPDNYLQQSIYRDTWTNYLELLNITKHQEALLLKQLFHNKYLRTTNIMNICTIVKLYPKLVKQFITLLKPFNQEVLNFQFYDDYNFIIPCSSDSYELGILKYKENATKESIDQKRMEINLKEIDKDFVFERIKKETITSSLALEKILKIYLYAYENGVEDLESLTVESVLELIKLKKSQESDQIKYLLSKD